MTEKEMIEEMAQDMNFACVELSKEQRLEIARVLINLDYCKRPEGSVVLYKDEAQKYYAYKIIEPQIKGCLDRERKLEKQVKELEEQRDRQAYIAEELIQEKHRWTEQARKETAKEILFKVESAFAYYDNEDMFSKKAILECVEEIAKQFGVEIKEQK